MIKSGSFEQNLYYNTFPANIDGIPCYNGNISASTWTYGAIISGYKYEYDELNRLERSVFRDISSNNLLENNYYDEAFRYDKHGNIEHLSRTISGGDIDALTFNYDGNQVKSIYDDEGSRCHYLIKEYQNLANEEVEFFYDENGNMKTDLDREIVTIRYNLLNLPDTIQFKNGNQIVNKYDASGVKLSSDYYTCINSTLAPLNVNEIYHWNNTPWYMQKTGTRNIGNIEYEIFDDDWNYPVLTRIHNSEGYVDNLDVVMESPRYNYYRRDHLGNNREVWHAPYSKWQRYNYPETGYYEVTQPAATIQRTQYYPSGLPIESKMIDNPGIQPYKYNGKEFVEMHGYDVTELGNRGVYHAINRFTSIDRFAEKYPWQSPYVFAGNNPVNYVDVNGDSVIISGSAIQPAFEQAQVRVSSELKLDMKNGTITASQISTGALSNDAQQLFDAITSSTIFVNIITVNGNKDANDILIIGGGFGGNTVTKTENGNTVAAIQTINPQVLEKMSNAHGTPGKDVLHEITEAFQGAKISQKSGLSSPASNQSGSVYKQAHLAATPQSGIVTQTAYTTIGTPMPPLPSGPYQYPVGKVEWSVVNTSGVKTIIQTLR